MQLPVLTINELFDMLDAYMANGVDPDTPVYFWDRSVTHGDVVCRWDDETGLRMTDILMLKG